MCPIMELSTKTGICPDLTQVYRWTNIFPPLRARRSGELSLLAVFSEYLLKRHNCHPWRRTMMHRHSWILCSFVLGLTITHALAADSRGSQQSIPPRAPSISSGLDKPSLVFYSDVPGSGNNAVYNITLPGDPATPPRQDGSGGTFNYQLYSAFEFGMVLCDNQSSPNFTNVCVPNTDANIFDNPDPNAPDFVSHHPGSAVLEVQFYPPGGLNTCSDPKLWCVAVTITSLTFQNRTETRNSLDCLIRGGFQPVNFAFLTTDGVAQTAADPLNHDPAKFNVVPGKTFQMRSGDHLLLSIHDTPGGVKATVHDLTTDTTGSMTAGPANGFAQLNFDPDPDPTHPSKTCTSNPYAFHPMYATSNEHTRSSWLSHPSNISFTAVIGNFEYCNAVSGEGGSCLQSQVNDASPDADEKVNCFSSSFLGGFGLQPVGGCFGADTEFDSVSYLFKWPGTGDAREDRLLKPSPILFTSPQFRTSGSDDDQDQSNHRLNFDRVAFESEAPIVEAQGGVSPPCDVFSADGSGCVQPPTQFYPIFSSSRGDHGCVWQLGGPHIPGTIDNFGGNAAAQYGDLITVLIIGEAEDGFPDGEPAPAFLDFRRILPANPCVPSDNDNENGDR